MIQTLKRKAAHIALAGIVAFACVGAATATALVSTATDTTVAYADEWKKSGNRWWYQTGKSYAKGWKQIGGTWYYFNDNGWMKTGWQKIGGTWYYLKSSGAMATGWNKIGSTWYYHTSSGVMKTGWNKIGSTWYYHNSSGAMLTGWQAIGGKWYYFNGSGAMQTDRWVGNYYVKNDGTMAKNEWIGHYHVNGNGVWDDTNKGSETLPISTEWYTLNLPIAWKDKVSYKTTGTDTTVYLKGHDDCVLFSISVKPYLVYVGGDIGGFCAFRKANNAGNAVELWVTNWVVRAADTKTLSNYKSAAQRDGLLSQLIELQTGGLVSLDQARANPGSSEYSTIVHDHINCEIASNMVVHMDAAPL